MQFLKHENLLIKLLPVFLTLGLTACLGGGSKDDVTRYYLIDPEVDAQISTADKPELAIRLRDLDIPQYLQRFQIVTRSAENRLRLSEFNQWGENLTENLTRTLARNLSVALATNKISTPLDRTSIDADYRISVHIQQFEHDADNHIKLIANWEIAPEQGQANSVIHHYNKSSEGEIAADDYDAIVQSMQSLFASLSISIASSLMEN